MTRTIRIAVATLVTALAASIPSSAEAQTITACYSGKTGTFYRVGEPNTPADCTKGGTKETWGVQGPQGPQGVPGAQGPQGPAGAPGVSGLESLEKHFTLAPNAWQTLAIACPEGKYVLGGGFASSSSGDVLVYESRFAAPADPSLPATTWVVKARNRNGEADGYVSIYALCAGAA